MICHKSIFVFLVMHNADLVSQVCHEEFLSMILVQVIFIWGVGWECSHGILLSWSNMLGLEFAYHNYILMSFERCFETKFGVMFGQVAK